MNEQYTNDIEDLISNSTELKGEDFWLGMYAQCSFFWNHACDIKIYTNYFLGIEKSWSTLREENIFQFENNVYIFNQHFSKWGSR